MPDTERINLPDGQWWDVRTVVTRRLRKAFRRAGLKGFMRGIDGNSANIDISDRDALQRAVLAHPDAWDVDAIDDAYLIEGTVAYSFSDNVSLQTIDSLPNEIVEPVLVRMRELYIEMPESEHKSFFGPHT